MEIEACPFNYNKIVLFNRYHIIINKSFIYSNVQSGMLYLEFVNETIN